MMNKEEIEKILKHLKRLEERYLELKAKNSAYNDDEYYAHLLLQYIEDLQQRIDKATNILKGLRLIISGEQDRKEQIDLLLEILGGKE